MNNSLKMAWWTAQMKQIKYSGDVNMKAAPGAH